MTTNTLHLVALLLLAGSAAAATCGETSGANAAQCSCPGGQAGHLGAINGSSASCLPFQICTAGADGKAEEGSANGTDAVCSGVTCGNSTGHALAAGVACRASADDCDVAEVCDGTSLACPADGMTAAGVTCRATADICDVAGVCDGAAAACPANTFKPAGTSCRANTTFCDLAEACTGAAAACPPNAFKPNTTVRLQLYCASSQPHTPLNTQTHTPRIPNRRHSAPITLRAPHTHALSDTHCKLL